MVELRFHGHSCWEIASGASRILIDPFLEGNPLADVGPDAFTKLDAILVSHAFPFGHVKLTIAHHGSTGPDGEPLGNPVGFVITIGGKKIYHAGDTGLFSDMKLIAEQNGPLDVALLPIGDNFTMGIDDAARAAELLQAKVTIPMHYDTFDVIRVDAATFVRKVEAKGLRCLIVRPGETHSLA